MWSLTAIKSEIHSNLFLHFVLPTGQEACAWFTFPLIFTLKSRADTKWREKLRAMAEKGQLSNRKVLGAIYTRGRMSFVSGSKSSRDKKKYNC